MKKIVLMLMLLVAFTGCNKDSEEAEPKSKSEGESVGIELNNVRIMRDSEGQYYSIKRVSDKLRGGEPIYYVQRVDGITFKDDKKDKKDSQP